jgi:hypothetical protein
MASHLARDRGGAGNLGGPAQSIAARTSGSAQRIAGRRLPEALRRSHSLASSTPADHQIELAVNPDASRFCIEPDIGVPGLHE